MLVYDPPSGWMYGFPKPFKPLPGETLEETLLRDGYSEKEFDENGKVYWCRFLGGKEELEKMHVQTQRN